MPDVSADDDQNPKMLECSHCPKTFRYNSERIRHEMSHSPGFECEICCKKFSFISALRRHHKQHERTGSVKCEQCNRKFRDNILLKRHIKYAHKGSFTCSKCSSTFSSEQALCTHMKTHKPESERRFKCSYSGCEKSFNFSHHLKHHELTHTNVKQHYCSVCGKGFIQSHHLKTHLKTHNPNEWLYCEFPGCKKKFSTEYAKKRHMATHKVKPDSGISSDSNSCDASVTSKEDAEDTILCASCGENVHQSEVVNHSARCGDILDASTDVTTTAMDPIKNELFDEHTQLSNHVFGKTPIKQEISFDNFKDAGKFDKDVGGCTSALGGCMMGANNCVCVHMTKPIDENYDFAPIDQSNHLPTKHDQIEINNNVDFIDRYSEVVLNFFHNKENEVLNKADPNPVSKKYQNNMCEGCDCAKTCTVKEPANCIRNVAKDLPIVHTVAGVLRITDTFDIDIPIKEERSVKESRVNKIVNEFVPFSTCRDVIGNCIVGGSEGCLCARMLVDEQQAMAQEIDDITPVPKIECYA